MQTKKTSWAWAAALFAALLVAGVGLTGCDTGSSSGGTGGGTPTYNPVVYNFDDGTTLTVTRAAKAAVDFTPATGDSYTLKYGTTIISTGKITIDSTTSTWSFSVDTGSKVTSGTFKATMSSGSLTFTSEITYTNNGATQKISAGTEGSKSGGGSTGTEKPTTGGSTTDLQGAWKADDPGKITAINDGDTSVPFSSLIIIFNGKNCWQEMKWTHGGVANTMWYRGTFTISSTGAEVKMVFTDAWSNGTWGGSSDGSLDMTLPYTVNGNKMTCKDPHTSQTLTFTKTTAPAIPN